MELHSSLDMAGRGGVDVKGDQIDEILHRFFDKVRKNVHAHQTQVSLDFQERLNEPVKEELPRLFGINVQSFYQGEYFAKQAINDYQPLQEFSRDTQEGNFHTRNAEKLSKLSEIFHESEGLKQNVLRHVMILGPVGSGKTTTLMRFGRDAVNGEILCMKGRFIHIVKCRSFQKDKEITVQEFLFRYMHSPLSDDESRIGYKWVLENSEKVVLIIDSLDTLGYELDDETKSIEPWDHAPPSTILYNIFIGQILKKTKILSSSREYKVGKYGQILHPDRIISVGGLSHESIQNLVFGFLKEDDAERAWEILDKKCPDLMALCEIPMFLTFAMVVLAEKSFIPNTGTGIMINLLQCFLRSKHARAFEKHDIEYVVHAVNKMKELAFKGTMEGKVIFSEEDLTEVQLTPNEVTDLAIVVPGSLNKEERDIEAMFAHQKIQEVLTALFIGQKSEKDFSEFILKYLHGSEFSDIRKMLNGIFLDPLVSDALKHLLEGHCEIQSHKDILVESMAAEVGHFEQLSENGRLDIIRAIHEAGTGRKDIVPFVWNSVDLSYMPLMTADLHALASSLLDCSYLKQLILWQCNLTEGTLCDFANRLENSSVKLELMDVSLNDGLSSRGHGVAGSKGMGALGKIVVCHDIKNLGISGCKLSAEDAINFRKAVGGYKVEKLLNKKRIDYFSSSSKVHDNQFEAMSEFLPVVSKNIDMAGWELKQHELDFLKAKALQFSQEINLSLDFGTENARNTIVISSPGFQELELQESRNSESQDRVVAFTEVEGQVDPNGGTLQIGNSSITIHPGTFRTRTKIWMRLEIDSTKWPEHYMCITRMLYVKAENRPTIPATVRLSWYKHNGTKESRESSVNVLHCPDIAWKWRVIERLPFNNDLVFQFDCLDFSPVVIGQEEGHLQENNFVVQGYIFGHEPNLCLLFCLDKEFFKGKLDSDMEKCNANLLMAFTPITVKCNDILKTVIRMEGESEIEDQSNQENETSKTFQINEDFLQKIGRKRFNFPIPKNVKKSRLIQFKCDLYKNNIIEDADQRFLWELSSVTESGNPTTVHVHGDIKAAVVGLGQAKINLQGAKFATAGLGALEMNSNDGPVLKELPSTEARISKSMLPGSSCTDLTMDDCQSSETESVTVESQSAASSSKMEETQKKRLASEVAEQHARGEIKAENLYLGSGAVKINSKNKKRSDSEE